MLGWPVPQALGALGLVYPWLVKSEVMHYGYALIMLAGIYYGSQYGGSTTAILVNIPGEAASVVTCLDGYQMARQGRAGPALAVAALGSFFAGTVATSLPSARNRLKMARPRLATSSAGSVTGASCPLQEAGARTALDVPRGTLDHCLRPGLIGVPRGTRDEAQNSGRLAVAIHGYTADRARGPAGPLGGPPRALVARAGAR